MNSIERIEYYIPQRPPMIMVDAITEITDKKGGSIFEVKLDNIFVKNELITVPLLLENIAQTAAAHAGYWSKMNDNEVALGYIVAIKDAEFNFFPTAPIKIETEIEILNQIMEFTVISGKCFASDQCICSCEMRIYVKPIL